MLILTISEVEARELALGCKAVPLRAVQNRDISLNRARALYANADIYLLDDILMAVDSRVGRAIFDKAIKGFLNTKTVIVSVFYVCTSLASKIHRFTVCHSRFTTRFRVFQGHLF